MTAEFKKFLLGPSGVVTPEINEELVDTPFNELVYECLHDLKDEITNRGFTRAFFEKLRLNSEGLLSYWQQRMAHLRNRHQDRFESLQVGDFIDLGDQSLQLDSFRDTFANKFRPCFKLSWIRGNENDGIFFPESDSLAPAHVDLAIRGSISRPGEKYYARSTYEVRFEKGAVSRIETRRFYQKDRKNHELLGVDVPSGAHVEEILDLSWLFEREDFTVKDLVR